MRRFLTAPLPPPRKQTLALSGASASAINLFLRPIGKQCLGISGCLLWGVPPLPKSTDTQTTTATPLGV